MLSDEELDFKQIQIFEEYLLNEIFFNLLIDRDLILCVDMAAERIVMWVASYKRLRINIQTIISN